MNSANCSLYNFTASVTSGAYSVRGDSDEPLFPFSWAHLTSTAEDHGLPVTVLTSTAPQQMGFIKGVCIHCMHFNTVV